MSKLVREKKEVLVWVLFALSLIGLAYLEFGLRDPKFQVLELILTMVLALFVIMKSSSFALSAISHYAEETGISKYLIGFLVVSLGTSLPELTTGVFSSLAGKGQLILGDVIGANIVDVAVVLGAVAIISKKLMMKGSVSKQIQLLVIFLVMLPVVLGLNGVISRFDGVILIVAFVVYLVLLLRKEGSFGKIKKNVPLKNIWQDMIVFTGCVIALLLSARWLVVASLKFSEIFNIPIYLMGLVFISLGTTAPELTVDIKAALQGVSGIGIGDILGSVVVNSLLVIGIAALINPITVQVTQFLISSLFMIYAVILASSFLQEKQITWKHGTILLLYYVFFITTTILMHGFK